MRGDKHQFLMLENHKVLFVLTGQRRRHIVECMEATNLWRQFGCPLHAQAIVILIVGYLLEQS